MVDVFVLSKLRYEEEVKEGIKRSSCDSKTKTTTTTATTVKQFATREIEQLLDFKFLSIAREGLDNG